MSAKTYWVGTRIYMDISIKAENEDDARLEVVGVIDDFLYRSNFTYDDFEIKKVKQDKEWDYIYDEDKKLKKLYDVIVVLEKEVTVEAEDEAESLEIARYEVEDDLYNKGVIYSKVVAVSTHLNDFYYEED